MKLHAKGNSCANNRTGNNAKILIADDSHTDQLLLQTILRNQGHHVLIASDGVEAVAIFAQERPDIVLLDALMPHMDGFEAAANIKQLAGDEFVPIIFLTSLQSAEELAKCLNAGGDDFLSKPYSSVILQAKINAFIRMREMHRTVIEQRDQISTYNSSLLREQEIAKRIFDKVAHAGCLDAANIQYALSPIAIFNGDVALAGVQPSGNLAVLLGDFTGHGLDAAIGAMPLAQSFYSMLEKGFALTDILREINLKLHEALPVGVFCCAVVAELDFKAGILRVWNGGLPDCVIYRAATKTITPLTSKHLPLGILSNDQFSNRVDTYEVELGDRLYLWSDGILEAKNNAGEFFAESRLMQVFEDNKAPETLFHEINLAVNSFLGEGELSDDISLIEVTVVSHEQFAANRPSFIGSAQAGPKDWSLRYELRAETLKAFDPLPLLLHVLMDIPFLRSIGGQIYTVMAELYTNALEHGVLGLGSELKGCPEGFNHYYQLRKDRLEQLTQGSVTILLDYCGTQTAGVLTIDVIDSGDGFDYWQGMGQPPAGNNLSGRGINLLRSICHSLTYFGKGNHASAVFIWGDKSESVAVSANTGA